MYKMLTNADYPTFRNSIQLRRPTHRYPTSRSTSYVVPFPRTEAIRGNFEHQSVVVWNSIPETIRNLGSTQKFKKALIKNFIEGYVT